MFLCLRVDLDYVPWDEPDAQEFGHGEPAMIIRLLQLGRDTGVKFHFFASDRALRTFPAAGESILGDGHDLDWLNKHPDDFEHRYGAAVSAFSVLGARIRGFATRTAWPEHLDKIVLPVPFDFISAPPGWCPDGVRHFPVETRPERDALRAGQTVRTWSEGVRTVLREKASKEQSATVVIRPQVMAKVDPTLRQVRELIEFALAIGLRQRTLRDVIDGKV